MKMRIMKAKILYVVSLLLGLILINGGLNKFFNYMPMPEEMPKEMLLDFNAMMEIVWLMPLIGIAEIIGGMLLIFPKTRAFGAVFIFPVMVGILLTHIFVEVSGLPMALAMWIILGWILFENREKYKALFA